MKQLCAVVLAVVVASHSVLFAADDWSRIRAIPPGSPVVVRAIGRTIDWRAYFVSADEDGLVLLDASGAMLSPKAERFLKRIAETHPEYLTIATGEFRTDDFRFSGAGLFHRGKLIAAHADVIKTVPRGEVVDVAQVFREAEGLSVAGHAAMTAGIFIGVPLVFFLIACARGCK